MPSTVKMRRVRTGSRKPVLFLAIRMKLGAKERRALQSLVEPPNEREAENVAVASYEGSN